MQEWFIIFEKYTQHIDFCFCFGSYDYTVLVGFLKQKM